jgi:polygalacturonase
MNYYSTPKDMRADAGETMRLPNRSKGVAFLLMIVMAGIGAAAANASALYLKAYAKASYETTSSVYTLKVDNTSVDVVKYFNKYSYAHLAYEGTATFAVTLKSGVTITSFDISPHSYGLNPTATKSGATLTFNLPQVDSRYLVVRISTSSGAQELLVIAADPEEMGAPTIGGNVIDITASPYNADKTGGSLLTSTIQNAINDRHNAGGGTVYFPAGVYKISHNILLRANVTLYLAAGAVLRGSGNSGDYTWSTTGSQQGACNIVMDGNSDNVAIRGRGMIDGNSTVLATGGSSGPHRKGIISSGMTGTLRPTAITLEGITVKDATTWTLNIEDAKNVTVQNVKLLNDYDYTHSDGFDMCSSDTVLVDNCLGVTGDDVFDAKAPANNPEVNVTYSNSVAYSHRGCGVKVGVQCDSTADNITFSNIDVISGYRGMSISHDQGTAAYTNINFYDVRTESISDIGHSGQFQSAPFVFWTLGGGAGPVTGVKVIRCYIEDCGGLKGIIQGTNSSSKVSNVAFEALQMDGAVISSSNYTSKINLGSNTSNVTFATGGVYTLVNHHSGKALDNGNSPASDPTGEPVNQWTVNGTTPQKWTITAVGNESYKLVSVKSGRALDNGNTTTVGSGIIQWDVNGTSPQQWKIAGAANGCVKLTSVKSNQVLDDDNSTTEGSQVVQWTDNAGPQQQWKLNKQ